MVTARRQRRVTAYQTPHDIHGLALRCKRLDRERHRLAVFGYGALASNDRPT